MSQANLSATAVTLPDGSKSFIEPTETLSGIMARMMFTWLADHSGSMNQAYTPKKGGEPISRAVSEQQAFGKVREFIANDPKLSQMVQIAECRFGTQVHHSGFHPAHEFVVPDVDVGPTTMFKAGLVEARDHIKRGIIEAVNSDGDYLPGLTVAISDGQFSDGPVNDVVAEMQQAQQKREGFFYGVGFTDEDKQRLIDSGFSPQQTFSLEEVDWSDIVVMMIGSVRSLSVGQIPQDLQ